MSNSSNLLTRFLLYPLLYTLSSSAEGVVVAIGMLLIYPFMSILSEFFRTRVNKVESVYFISFLGVFLGSLYILVIGIIDWEIYQKLKFIFPASMSVSALLLSWLDSSSHEIHESTHFVEALVSAFLLLSFTCVRELFMYGSLDFRFGGFGDVFVFGGSTPFKARAVIAGTWMEDLMFSPIFSKSMIFWGVAILLSVISAFQKKDDGEV